jgi:class 3 adenylate cyclase
MFTDAVGSTALITGEGDERSLEMIAHSNRLVREAFIEHGGREIEGLGDGSFCAFRGLVEDEFELDIPLVRPLIWGSARNPGAGQVT